MGLLNSALQIGRTALLSYQGALQVVGGNISSAGSPDYTRLSPLLDPLQGSPMTGGLQPGAGVALSAIQRNIDEALEGRIRLAIGGNESYATQETAMGRIEIMFDDLSGMGLGSRIIDYLNAFEELQNTPENRAIRDLVVANGASLANNIRDLRSQLNAVGEDIDSQIGAIVVQADQIARSIGDLNTEIIRAEAQGQSPATGLRDQRDALLRELSELFDVTVREQTNGTINVYIGSETLVQGNFVRSLTSVETVDGETTRTSVRFADTNQQIEVRGGRLEGLILSRDQYRQVEALDTLANALIAEVNLIHSNGQGLIGFTSVEGTNDVFAVDVPLDDTAAGLKFPPKNGSFYITVTDDVTQTPVAFRIEVDLDGTSDGTTLESLVADFNAQVTGVSASITGDNRLALNASDGFTFTFGHDGQEARDDTSEVLVSLGINTFFTGGDARDIAINQTLQEESSFLAAATVFLPGDGENAGRLGALDMQTSGRLGGTSIPDFYRAISNTVAVTSAALRDGREASESVLASLRTQRESISGVNLDEEAISLIKYQRAFQGAARFIGVVDDLLSELILLVR